MPDLVGDHLVFRRLQDESDLLGLFPLGQFPQQPSLIPDFSGEQTVRGQAGFQMPQQRGFSAAGRAAENDKFSLLNGEGNIAEGFFLPLRVCKFY